MKRDDARAAVGEDRFRLVAHSAGRRLARLVPPAGTTVGSSERNDLRLEARGVSRHHARFVPAGEVLWVEDRGSKNGIWLGDRRIERQALAAGDRVRLGEVWITVERVAADDAEVALAWPRSAARAPAPALEEPTTLLPGAGSPFELQPVATLFPGLRLPEEFVVGPSGSMLRLLGEVERVAAGRAPALLLGETGTGKELIARAIHSSSARGRGPFVVVNCAALPAELVEAELFGVARGAATGVAPRDGALRRADGGTFLLDEVGELPMALQAKFLRVLESGEVTPLGGSPASVDVRFVAATNRDLRAEAESGRFRTDLYFRLAGFTLHLPPLRERREDLPTLLGALVERCAREAGREPAGLSLRLLERVSAYSWPGNLRELAHEVRRWVTFAPEGEIFDSSVLSDEIRSAAESAVASQPEEDRDSLLLEERMASTERELVVRALAVAGGNQSRAARLLGISRNGLAAKMARHGLGPQGEAEGPDSETDDDRS